MDTRLAIVRERGERGEDDTRRTENDRDDSGSIHAHAECGRLLITCPGDLP